MKKKLIENLFETSRHLTGIDINKSEAMLFVAAGNDFVKKGFCLKESSYSLCLTLWFKPYVYFCSSLLPYGTFEFYEMKCHNIIKEIRFDKGGYSDSQIINLVCNLIEENISFLDSVVLPSDILDSVLNEREPWGRCIFGKENLALLCFLYNRMELVEKLLKEALGETNERHPLYKDIYEFYCIISANDIVSAERFVADLVGKCSKLCDKSGRIKIK